MKSPTFSIALTQLSAITPRRRRSSSAAARIATTKVAPRTTVQYQPTRIDVDAIPAFWAQQSCVRQCSLTTPDSAARSPPTLPRLSRGSKHEHPQPPRSKRDADWEPEPVRDVILVPTLSRVAHGDDGHDDCDAD